MQPGEQVAAAGVAERHQREEQDREEDREHDPVDVVERLAHEERARSC